MTRARPLVARAAAVVAGVVFTWEVSWLLTEGSDKTAIGAWSVVFTAIFAVGTVTRFGCENLAVRVTSSDPTAGMALARSSLVLVSLLSVPGVLLLGLVAYTRPGFEQSSGHVPLSVAAGLIVVSVNATIMAGSWMRALGLSASGAFFELGAAPVLAGLVLAALSRLGVVSLADVVVAYLVSTVLVAAGMHVAAALAFRTRVESQSPMVSLAVLWQRRGGLVAYMVTALGFFMFSYVAILIYGAFGFDASAAEYRNCFTLAALVGLVPTMQSSYLMPQFARLHGADAGDELAAVVRSSNRVAAVCAVTVAVPLLVFPRQVLRVVFGEAYVGAAPVLGVLALGSLVVVTFGPVYGLMTMVDLERVASRLMVVVLCVGVVLMLVALRIGGPLVLAAFSVVPPIAFAAAGHVVLRRHGIHSGVWPGGWRRPVAS